MTQDTLRITRPDDWHLHVRDGDALGTTVPHTARQFGRAIIMPNLKPPVTTLAMARDYRERILSAVPAGVDFEPLMTLYLTDTVPVSEVHKAKESGLVQAIKYYPAGATTNSESGVTGIDKVYPILEAMQEVGMPLLIHGEVTDGEIDIFDREKVFIESVLTPLKQRFPELKMVLEHITTRDAVQFVSEQDARLAATITVHHLLYNRNHMLVGGIRPHYFCMPILKRDRHQQALIEAATSGSPKFFLGTDSAPHLRADKESACGCAGVYSAPAALELYAEMFDRCQALDRLEGFASFHGADFYGLPRNTGTVTLKRQAWHMPAELPYAGDKVVPICAGEELTWQLVEQGSEGDAP